MPTYQGICGHCSYGGAIMQSSKSRQLQIISRNKVGQFSYSTAGYVEIHPTPVHPTVPKKTRQTFVYVVINKQQPANRRDYIPPPYTVGVTEEPRLTDYLYLVHLRWRCLRFTETGEINRAVCPTWFAYAGRLPGHRWAGGLPEYTAEKS